MPLKMGYRTPVYSRTIAATISVVLYSSQARWLVVVTLEGQCEVIEGFIVTNDIENAEDNGAVTHRAASFASSCKRNEHGSNAGSKSKMFAGDNTNKRQSDALDREYKVSGPSYVFPIQPNCTCGDVSAGEGSDNSLVFLGSYDGHVYVYSISDSGELCGSLFFQSQVSSMKSFILSNTSNSDFCVGTEGCSGREPARASPPSSSSAPGTDGKGVMLLVCTAQCVSLLASARSDIKHWYGHRQPRSVSIGVIAQEEDFLTTSKDSSLWNVNPLPRCMELFLSNSTTNAERTAPLRPIWQYPLSLPSRHAGKSSAGGARANFTVRGSSVDSRASSLSWHCPRHHIITTPTTAAVQHRRHHHHQLQLQQYGSVGSVHTSHEAADSLSPVVEAKEFAGFPAAIDVAAADHAIQFVVATEDGRWFVFEIPVSPPSAQSGASDSVALEDSSRISTPRVAVSCILSGCLRDDVFVQRACILPVGPKEFCAVLMDMGGTCYALDTRSDKLITSHVKADVLSFTVIAGGSVVLAPGSETGATQQRLVSRHVGRGFLLLSVAIDEVAVLSIDGESHTLDLSSDLGNFGFCGFGSALHIAPRAGVAANCDERVSVERGGRRVAAQADGGLEDEEDVLMLQLGTLILREEAGNGGDAVFSEEYRRFVARKFCAFGFTQSEWKLLRELQL
uniref:Uncharacterized protein TCIL3000_1_800 n=1 Tax=Trypanosoma congolense (strain IL3000) TaxID=1068625 RepID=G0UIW4_TRYCI|nr:unnamed protein product [Trypanosoma congolense IL3000]